MDKIIGGKGTGKTRRLLEIAKDNNGIVVCENVEEMTKRAHRLGIPGIYFIDYKDYICGLVKNSEKPVYIANINKFLKVFKNNIAGYSLSLEELK